MHKRMVKSTTDKKICGVCAGVADFFGIDPTIIRIIWAITALGYGITILIYFILAFALPSGETYY